MDEHKRYEIETPVWTDEMLAKRRSRAKVMAWALIAFVALFFTVTLVKLGANVLVRPL